MTTMKLISLNTYGGRAGVPALLDFFKKHDDADIFCLQEIYNGGETDNDEINENILGKTYNLLTLIKETLPDYQVFFRPHLKDHYGLAILVKNSLAVLEEGENFVYKFKGYIPEGDLGFHGRNVQYVKINIDEKEVVICNFHGLWNGKGKTDTEDRISQSKNLIDFVTSLSKNLVVAGDFNLLPDTESVRMIESSGLKNLIKDYGITSTRTSLYTKPDKYADYVFTSPTIETDEFKVLPDEVSDHAPLFIDFQ